MWAQVDVAMMRAFAAVRDSLRTVMIDVHESVSSSESGLERRKEIQFGESADERRRPHSDRQQTGAKIASGRVLLWI